MTRKEASNFLYKKMRSYSGKIETNKELVDLVEVDELISQIYNDFENRLCKNCKWKHKGQYEDEFWCVNPKNSIIAEDGMFVTEDFGCNRFERNK